MKAAGWTGYLIGIVAVSGLLLGHAPSRLIDTTYSIRIIK